MSGGPGPTPRALGQHGTRRACAPAHAAPAARWRAWSPLLLRAVAVFIALLGLAGIGRVASQTPVLPAPHALARAGLELGASPGLGVLTGGAPRPSAAPAAQPALELGAAPAASSAQTPEPRVGPNVEPRGEPCPPQAAPPPGAPAEPSPGLTADGRVILNRASALDLQRLPGVGAKRAAAILELRQRLGRFENPGDLLRIKGIGRRTLERMLPQLVLDTSQDSGARPVTRKQR